VGRIVKTVMGRTSDAQTARSRHLRFVTFHPANHLPKRRASCFQNSAATIVDTMVSSMFIVAAIEVEKGTPSSQVDLRRRAQPVNASIGSIAPVIAHHLFIGADYRAAPHATHCAEMASGSPRHKAGARHPPQSNFGRRVEARLLPLAVWTPTLDTPLEGARRSVLVAMGSGTSASCLEPMQ
jgi:hypothetical protein